MLAYIHYSISENMDFADWTGRSRWRQGKDSIQCSDSGSKSEENYFTALYLHSLSLCSGCGCSCSSSVKGALYLAQPQAHCVALSLDWVWPRQPVTLRLSMEDKLQRCTTQWGRPKYSPWPCRGAKLEVKSKGSYSQPLDSSDHTVTPATAF